MNFKCDVCKTKDSVAISTVPNYGTYSVCDDCMSNGKRPECHCGCGHQGELTAEGLLWCSDCYQAHNSQRESEAISRQQERAKIQEAVFEDKINKIVDAAFKKRGF